MSSAVGGCRVPSRRVRTEQQCRYVAAAEDRKRQDDPKLLARSSRSQSLREDPAAWTATTNGRLLETL